MNRDIYYEFKPISIQCINVNKFHLEYSHLFPDTFEHEYILKGTCLADKALFNLFVLNVLGN